MDCMNSKMAEMTFPHFEVFFVVENNNINKARIEFLNRLILI